MIRPPLIIIVIIIADHHRHHDINDGDDELSVVTVTYISWVVVDGDDEVTPVMSVFIECDDTLAQSENCRCNVSGSFLQTLPRVLRADPVMSE